MFFAYALIILLEDIAHHFGFFFVDDHTLYELALFAGYRFQFELIAVNDKSAAESTVCYAGVKSVADSFGKPFTVFLGIPFKEHLIKLATFVFGNRFQCRYDLDSVLFFQHLLIDDAVAAISGEPIEHIHDNVSEGTCFCVGNHLLKCRTGVVCPRSGFIGVKIDDIQALAFGVFFADTHLRFDALFILSVRTETSVYDTIFHEEHSFA